MKPTRIEWTTAEDVARRILDASAAKAPNVDLAPIRESVIEGGDRALIELTNELDAVSTGIEALRVPASELRAAAEALVPDLRKALLLAIENVGICARAQVGGAESEIEMPQGHLIAVGEAPVASAAVYAPGGRRSYPSSVVMGVITARAAGVGRVVVASPPGPDGEIDATTLAAAELCGADEVYRIGGAQAIYALAYGTESIDPVDVIVGPGNTWVTEAKKDVFGRVGIDSPAGPSDITIVYGPDADQAPLALDLCAQAEHGSESPLTAISLGGAGFDRLSAEVEVISAREDSVNDCLLFMVEAPSRDECLDLVERLAPEHLQLVGDQAESLAADVTTAGCVFVGPFSATAFGDYVAGSNHILPTGGAGRTFGPLSPSTFRRSTSRVTLDGRSAEALVEAVEALSEVEGLPVHGQSARARLPR